MDPTKKDTPGPRAKEKPKKDGRRSKIALESNPIPTRDTQRAQTNLVNTRTRNPTETEPELCLNVFCRGTGQQWPTAGVAFWVQ